MNRQVWARLLALLVLVVVQLVPAFGLDGASAISSRSVACGYVAWGTLYDRLIEYLQGLGDNPSAEKLQVVELARTALQPLAAARPGDAPTKACLSNLRVLLGAVEMYNMDHKEMQHSLDVGVLVQKTYLKLAPACPSGGDYSSKGDLAESGVIVCSKHGTVDEPIQDEQDKRPTPFPETAQALAAEFLEFHARAEFRPSGAIWISLDNDLRPTIVCQATIKPRELLESVARRFIGLPKPKSVDENRVQFEFYPSQWGKQPLVIEILRDGITVRVDPAARDQAGVGSGDSWKEFLTQAAGPEVISFFELDGERLREEMQRTLSTERRDWCLANLDLLAAAVTSYNQTVKEPMDRLDLQKLIGSRILRCEPRCPDQGAYSSAG
ncbi:MAG TPA: hypothetical protein PKO06_21140, partial [Candidatus Ozemobacteraceae bacterium]|nr:hypothetical protein [Candidatus Ozemobacteraceae bacterium]